MVPTDLPPLSSPDASSAVHAQTPSGATDLAHSGALFSRFLPDGEDRALQPGLAAGDRGSRPLGSRAGAGSSSSSLTGLPSPAARGSASLAPRRGRPAARRAGGRVRGDSARSLGYGCTCFAFLRAYVRPSSLNTDFADKPSLTRPTVAVRTWPCACDFPFSSSCSETNAHFRESATFPFVRILLIRQWVQEVRGLTHPNLDERKPFFTPHQVKADK